MAPPRPPGWGARPSYPGPPKLIARNATIEWTDGDGTVRSMPLGLPLAHPACRCAVVTAAS